MHDHREILALAAAAIDFELDPAERARLDAALATCSLCRRQASAVRATATVLRRPSDIGTPSRVRDVVVRATMRAGRRSPRFGSLVVASLLLLAVLGGTAVIVGSRGLGIVEPVPSPSPVPVQSPPAAATATPLPTPEPAPTPTETPTIAAVSPSPTVDGPLQAGDIAAMVTDGRLVIRTLPQATADSAIFKTKLYPGQRVLILEGPIEGSGYPWFRVRLGAIEGWVAAAGRDGDPWLASVRNGVIAFVRDATDGSGEAIHTADPDGTTGEVVLVDEPSLAHYDQLTWSPDGRRLAFAGLPVTPDIDPAPEIFVIDANGSNLIQITQNDMLEDGPAWSPDGSRLAFRQAMPNPAAASTVVVANADGSGLRVLGPGENPVWSPDGQQLAMTVTDGDASSIWVQGADGGNRRQVTDVSVAPASPAWSPDGQSLVFSSSGLFLVEVATGSVTPLTSRAGTAPAWSTRGMIAFWAADSPSPSILVMGSDGVGQRAVAEGVSFVAVPVWAPDGRRLLLGTEVAVSPIAIVDPTDGKMTTLTLGNGTIRSPAWQPLLP